MGRATFSSGLFAANDFRTRTHATLLGELAPAVLVPPTAEACIAGRDPVMEWILSRPRR
jgi:hypothetical protein